MAQVTTSAGMTGAASLPLTPQWHMGHAVTTPKRCCTAYRHRYVVYAATENAIAVVDATAQRASTTADEAAWRGDMRVFSLSSAEEEIAFVCGHPERDVMCVGTKQHGLYVTPLTHPVLAEASKLPRAVTGDVTFGAAFLFSEEANYLAFSTLLHSRPSDPTPHRLSLWCLNTHALLWRGAMAPLESMCSFSYDLSFAACQAGKVCLFTVQSGQASIDGVGGPSPPPSTTDSSSANPHRPHNERNRLVVLSRHCSTVEELSDAYYTCCIASPAEGEDTYLALTTRGFLVALHATSGAVTRWMDCKVPAATGLCVFGSDSLVLTGELARFFQVCSWDFQGKIKPEASTAVMHNGAATAAAEEDVFTSAVAANSTTLLLFYRSGAMSFHSVEPKPNALRLSVHRTSLFPAPLQLCDEGVGLKSDSKTNSAVSGSGSNSDLSEWLQVSSSLWCWWTPRSLVFVAAPGGSLVAAFGVSSTCITVHPASGVVVLYDVQRRALVAFGRTSTASSVAEVGVLPCGMEGGGSGEGEQEVIAGLASSSLGESLYALVSVPGSPLPPRLRRYRCGWGTVTKGGVSEKGFYMNCMAALDGAGSTGAMVATAVAPALSVSLPAGTHKLVVHTGGGGGSGTDNAAPTKSLEEVDRVVAVQRSSLVSIGLSSHRERAAAPAYAHSDVIQRVWPCRGGLLVVSARSCTLVQWRGTTSFRWAAKPLIPPSSPVSATGGRGGAERASSQPITATVAARRSDVAVLCVDRTLSVWQLSDSPRLLTTCAMASIPSLLMADVAETTRHVRLWGLGAAGVDAYQIGPLELTTTPTTAVFADVARTSPVTPVKEEQRTEAKVSRPARSPPTATSKLAPPPPPPPAAAAAAGSAKPAGGAPASARARPTARTPRSLASTVTTSSNMLAEARRQRRTASAGAPSSRQLSERFDQLTGFYARQKQENEANEHPRTPRTTTATRPSSQPPFDGPSPVAAAAKCPSPAPAEGDTLVVAPPLPPRPSTPPLPLAPVHAAAPTANAAVASASAIDVSALTVDSQALRGAGAEGRAEAPSSSPLPWCESPPQRGADPSVMPMKHGEDAVLHSSASSGFKASAAGPSPVTAGDAPQPSKPPRVHLRSTEHTRSLRQSAEGSDGASLISEHFTVQARHLRESLLHIKELLEQSELSESNAEDSLAPMDEANLDELASLLTTVAAQLHQRQVRRSAEND